VISVNHWRPAWADEVKRYSFWTIYTIRRQKIAVVDCTWDEALRLSKLLSSTLISAENISLS